MNRKTVRKLLALNGRFYKDFAWSFAASRSISDSALTCILPHISRQATILDLGCGNGRLAFLLDKERPDVTYLGIDMISELTAIARTQAERLVNISAEFRVVDITRSGWSKKLSGLSFDCIVILAVFHHIPGFDLRVQVLNEIAGLLAEKGNLILSAWQFLDNPRMKKKIVNWDKIAIAQKELEDNDYLLNWKRGGKGLRYCHLIDKTEMACLADKSGFRIRKTWRAGGREGNLSLYTLLEKNKTKKLK